MKTPFGKECRFFYGDYYRGRNFEECRLLTSPTDRQAWHSGLCKDCPVPGILSNNACPNMVLAGEIKKVLFKQRVKVSAYCTRVHAEVKDPNVGCGHCHENPF